MTATGGMNIGGDGTGQVEVDAGATLTASGDVTSSTPGIKMGVSAASQNNTLLVQGTNALVSNTLQMNVGQLGQASFTVQNGGTISSDSTSNSTFPALVLGFGSGAVGTGTVGDGGTLKTTGQLVIGSSGSGSLTIEDNGVVTSTGLAGVQTVLVADGVNSVGDGRHERREVDRRRRFLCWRSRARHGNRLSRRDARCFVCQ